MSSILTEMLMTLFWQTDLRSSRHVVKILNLILPNREKVDVTCYCSHSGNTNYCSKKSHNQA